MRKLVPFLALLCISLNLAGNDTLDIRNHKYIFENYWSGYSSDMRIWILSDTGKTKLLDFTLSSDSRDEFGGSCTQTTYVLGHDTLVLYQRRVSWGEQRPWGWDDESHTLSKSTYVFQSSGKLVLLTRIYGNDDPKIKKEVERKTAGCYGG